MSRTRKNPLLAAVAFVVLLFGGLSTAQASWFGPSVRFDGRFVAPHARVSIHARPFVRHSRFFFPRHAVVFRHFARPFRVVRVFVYDPYPRWVYRRVYYGASGYDPYCYPY